MTIEDIKEYVICINDGSGVIFQPMEENFTYILTAKHVFKNIAVAPYHGNIVMHYYSRKLLFASNTRSRYCNPENKEDKHSRQNDYKRKLFGGQ